MEYHPLPQPEEIELRERDDAMGAYFMMFATTALGLPLPIINLIASIVYYYVNKAKGRFVQFHILQSLYSQLPVTALTTGLFIWTVRNFFREFEFNNYYWGYLIMTGVVSIIYFIFSVVAAVKSNKGRFYYFFFFGKLAYHVVFQVREERTVNGGPINKAPKM